MEKHSFPYAFEEFQYSFGSCTQDLVRVGPKGYVYPGIYKQLASQYYNFEIRPDDIILTGFPRSGTTRCQETIWLLNNNLDYEKAKSTVIDDRCPLLEFEIQFSTPLFSESAKPVQSPSSLLPTAPSPRFIKSHLPFSLLPPRLLDTAKVVYMARDPRDVAISYYNMLKLKLLQDIEFEPYWNEFKDGKLLLTPIFEHIKEAWDQRNHPNLCFLTYEETSKDQPSTIRRLCKFFGKEYSEEQISELCEHLSFDNFKKNKSVNGQQTLMKTCGVINDTENAFIRKGKVRGWEEYFNEELKKNAAEWMTKNLAGTNLPFVV